MNYQTGVELAAAIRRAGSRSVWVEFDVDLAEELFGREFETVNGKARITRVRLYRADNGVLAAEPLLELVRDDDGH